MLLLYPTAALKEVEVGTITVEVVNLVSQRANMVDGSLPFKIIASMCNATPQQLKDIALADANRILMKAWINSHGTQIFTNSVPCDCGVVNRVEHSMLDTYVKPSVYGKEHLIVVGNKTHTVVLTPTKFNLQGALLKQDMGDEEVGKLLILNGIESVDGKAPDMSLSMGLYAKISDLLVPAHDELAKQLQVEKPCGIKGRTFVVPGADPKVIPDQGCSKPIRSEVSWLNNKFLENR